MVVLGVDPGTASMGYGAVEYLRGGLRLKGFGCIHTSKEDTPSHRLHLIHTELGRIIDEFQPEAVSVESLFFSTNAKTAIAVGQARGVALLAIEQRGLPVSEYTPLQVKSALTGQGKAEKHQVQAMVQRLLHVKEKIRPDDAADALAIAICHAHSSTVQSAKFKVQSVSQNKNIEELLKRSRTAVRTQS